MVGFRRAGLVAVVSALCCLAAVGSVDARSGTGTRVAQALDDSVRLNQIQVIGSHNSYHLLPAQDEIDLKKSVAPAEALGQEYVHAPLPVQFQSQKVRQIELDIYLDDAGGKYAQPVMRTFLGKGPYEPATMNQPGIKVLHVQDVDYASSCLTLKICLQQVKTWSDANPSHVPIAILLELKDTPLEFSVPGVEFVVPDRFDAAAMDQVDATIRSVFPDEKMITPDDVRGTHATVNEAVLAGDAWPTLGESRGKVMFMMDNGGGYRTTYLRGHPNLEGRALFTNAPAGAPDAAFVKMNDPFDTRIPDLVRAGYVVRTRADGDTLEARSNDTRMRDAALASGAQWVSTDYPMPGMAVGFTSSYYASIPGGTVARCNPVNGPEGCVSARLDTIFTPQETTPPSTPTTESVTPTTSPDSSNSDGTGGGSGSGAPSAPGASPVPAQPSYTG